MSETAILTLHFPGVADGAKAIDDWKETPCHIRVDEAGYVTYNIEDGYVQFTSDASKSATFQLEVPTDGTGGGMKAPNGYVPITQDLNDTPNSM